MNKFELALQNVMNHELQSGLYETEYCNWAHNHGFLAESACAYNLAENNILDYINDKDYSAAWPLNSWSRIWVDDKITLKYMLDDELARTMPEYYFYSTPRGIKKLADCPNTDSVGIEALIKLLKVKGIMACKANNGSLSVGFTKLEHMKGAFFLNDSEVAVSDIYQFASSPNLLFTEYLKPAPEFFQFNHLIPTIRLIVINPDGDNPRVACGYMRFATKECGAANYSAGDDSFNYFVNIDIKTGQYGDGRIVFHNRVIESPNHPDVNLPAEGTIPGWDAVLEMVDRVSKRLFNVEYMGYDIGIVEDGSPKIMEINSHPQIKIPQMYGDLRQDPVVRDYFEAKLRK